LNDGSIKKILPLVAVSVLCAGVLTFYLITKQPPWVLDLEALYVTDSDATLSATYDVRTLAKGAESLKIRFGYKEDFAGEWNYTDWREVSENGMVQEGIADLTPDTRYEFKLLLRYDSEEVSGPVGAFKTHATPLTYEAYGIVEYTVDGDTIQVNLTWVHPSATGVRVGSGQKVRFSGGIDAPELRAEGGPEAKNFVRGFCPWGTEVFLDLDNLSEHPFKDSLGRLLGVVYVKENGRWINVNAQLLRWGMEAYPTHNWLKYRGFTSEFDPDEWLADDYPYCL
jgi:endonuclease YncB( thermonuclease family)